MAIIGAILGDIAGSQYEFSRPKDLDWKHCELFTDRCYFTDDTVMTLATKLAVLNDCQFEKYYRQLGRQYPNVGYGGMFQSWLKNPDSEPYNSFGNGSAMRCSYIGEQYDSKAAVEKYASLSAMCTHNHEEGVKGAVVTAECVFMARTGATKNEIYEAAYKNYPSSNYKYGVDRSLDSYRDTYRWDVP